jgi:hypothetical protein
MASSGPAFWVDWRRSLPLRWRAMVVPYGKGLAFLLLAYAGATALFRPWALGMWWSLWVPMALSVLLCWWLWQPWGLLARDAKGESRRLPLLLLWVLVVLACHSLREYLHYRLGEVRTVHHVAELAQPGEAVFFFLRGPSYPDKAHHGRYLNTRFTKSKNGTRSYYTVYSYACPLLASPADTTTAPRAWLGYSYHETLGDNLTPSDVQGRSLNFGLRCDAQLDSANLADFSYLQRPEDPSPNLERAVQASRLSRASAAPLLLLLPMHEPFASRGHHSLRLALGVPLWGSLLIVGLLLVMPLRLEYS